MGKWECCQCLEDNSDSEEVCRWCDTLREEADRVRIGTQEKSQSKESKGPNAWNASKPRGPGGPGGPASGPDAAAEAMKATWAARRRRLLQQLAVAEVDFCAPEQRRTRLRALQLELHPDKHQEGHQHFAQEMFLLVQSRWEEDERSRERRQEEARKAEERLKEEVRRAEEALKREEAARAKEEALRRQKEAEEAEQKRRLDAAIAAAREEDTRRQEREEEMLNDGQDRAREDEGVQLDEDDSQELSPAECIAEQHIVNAWRRTQEQQVRNELMAQEVEEEGASMSKQMSKQMSMQIDVNISDIQGPLRTIKAERSWLVADIKKILERTEKIHRGRQRLLLGDGDVDDLQPLMNLAHSGPLNFVLVVCMDKHYRIDLFMEAFQVSWRVLQFASASIRANPKIIKLALQKDWHSLAFAAPSLRTDYRMARLAVKRSGLALEVLTPEMRNDRPLVLMAVQQDWQALKFASLRLRGDPGVVMEAVRQSIGALEFASQKLRGDRSLMLLAVKRDGGALRFASSKLQADVDLVIEALRQDGKAIVHAAPEVRADPKLHAAMKGNSEVLRFLGFDSRDRLSTEQELFDAYMGSWTSPYDDATIAAVLRRHR